MKQYYPHILYINVRLIYEQIINKLGSVGIKEQQKTIAMIEKIAEGFKQLSSVPTEKEKELVLILKELIKQLHIFNLQKLQKEKREIELEILIEDKEEEFSIDIGVERKGKKTIIIPEWILKIDTRTKDYLLKFISIKEAIIQLLNFPLTKIDIAIINILTVIWLRDYLDLKYRTDPFMKSINSMIYSEDNPALSNLRLIVFQNLVVIRNITFIELLNRFSELKNEKIDSLEIFEQLSKWINSLIITEDVIAPIFISERYIPFLDLLIELGYEKATPQFLEPALKKKYNIDVHQNTLRNYFKIMAENYSILWRAIINYDKLNLHNYFLTIELANEDKCQKLQTELLKIPYLKSLYTGKKDKNVLIYSPTLISPHLVGEQLNDRLNRLLKKKEIADYSLLMIHNKSLYTSLITKPYNPTKSFFEDLLRKSDKIESLHKHTFSYEQFDFSTDFKFYKRKLDFNLLYFLSVVISQHIVKSSHNYITSELEKLYEINEIPKSNVETRNYFLNQIEIRARRRDLLNYSLLMQKHRPVSVDTLVFEIPTVDILNEKELNELIERLQIFSFLGQITTASKKIFMIPGLSIEHPIKKLIEKEIETSGFESIFYNIRHSKNKYIPYHELFDFEEQKWKV